MKHTVLRISLFLMAAMFFFGAAEAQTVENFDYNFKIKGLKQNDTCLIAYYLGNKQYIRDTLISNADGVYKWKGNGPLDGGIYLFVLPGMNYFEFILTEPKFTLDTDLKDLIMKMKVKGSKENELFFGYLQYIDPMQKEAQKIREDLKPLKEPSPEKTELQSRLREIDSLVLGYRDKLIAANSEAFVCKVFNASKEIEIPKDIPLNEDGEPDKTWQYQYYKRHYFDFVDFQDERLLQTPVFQAKINDYVKKVTVQHPDSIIESCDLIISKTEGNEQMFKFCVVTLMNMYAGTKQMCFDKIYVHMAGEYYVSGKAAWVDSTQLAKIKDRYYKMLYNTCDTKAVNLALEDLDGKKVQLYDIKAPWTILVFWAYDCGHCKKEMPQLYEFYEEYKKHGVDVVAVSTKTQKDPWQKFVVEKKLEGWHNLADIENLTNFRIFYDIYSTPVIYLLDKDKVIVAKRLDVENLRKYLNHELGIEETPEEKLEEAPEGGGSH